MRDDWSGQLVVITGAASGIGRATAALCAGQGAELLLIDLNQASLEALSGEDWWQAGQCRVLAVDVTDEAALRETLPALLEELARQPAALVNSAGVAASVPFLETDAALIRKMVDVNVIGTFLVSRLFADACINLGVRPASITNIGSVSGVIGNYGRTAYGASKAAVMQMTRVMATELASKGIRVNAVAPGPVETPMIRSVHADTARQCWTERIPLNRYAAPDEIADVIGFLISPSAQYVTGQVIAADGGYLSAGVVPADA